MKRIGLVWMMSGLTIISVFTACSKEDKALTSSDVESIAINNVAANDAFNDVYAESEDVVSAEQASNFASASLQKSASTSGRSVAVSIASDTTITITYNGYTAQNGRKKDGIIIIKQSKKMWEKNAKRTLTLQNFTINDSLLIEGTTTVTNLGLVNFKLTLELNIQDAKVTNLNTGNWLAFNNTYTLTWDMGSNLASIWDDTFIIKGQGEGSNHSGHKYTITISDKNPLFMRPGCPWIIQGGTELVVNGDKSATIDFGIGVCDSKFTISLDETEKELESIKGSGI